MIPVKDSPEVAHSDAPLLRIDMAQMDAESIKVMLEQSRDGFYSNKELAPVREYSTNARDAHIQSGQPDRPIEVTLPSQLSPELRIRDFGNGLSFEALADVYFRYWKSTKRNSNDTNGCLGIGAKSAFAYAASYTVTSWCDGFKTIATGQKNGFADIIYRAEKPADEADGVEVVIPIQQKDVDKFVLEALEFFKFWDIRPIFHNVDEEKLKTAFNIMDTKPFVAGDGWAVRPAGYGKGESKAVMGFVPYNIDWAQVRNSLPPEVSQKVANIFAFLEENLTTIYFDNGTLSFTPNRESLQYNEPTIEALSKKLLAIYNSLLTLITDKISDAPDLWEAKIRYNRLFRKELDGFDKENVYGGNLNTLENILRSRIQWNGITLNNGLFEGLDAWDKNDGKVGQGHGYGDEFEPLFSTYVKNEDKTGIKLCKTRRRYGYNSKMIASPKSIVVVQDTDKTYLAKGLARWFLYRAGSDVQQVYVLDLSNPTVKADFYKEFQFDTVPVTYVSANVEKVKAYLKTQRAPRGSAGAIRDSKPLYCPYVEVKSRRSSTWLSDPSWNYENVNARQLAGGGVYVVYSKDSFNYNGREISHEDSKFFWQAIWELSEKNGSALPKVYGIHPKTANSVWFKESVEEGDWKPLSEWIEENIDILPKEVVKKVAAWKEAGANRIGTVPATILLPLIIDDVSVAGQYFNLITAEIAPNYNLTDIPSALRLDGWGAEDAETTKFAEMNKAMKEKYPLLFKFNDQSAITNCVPTDTYHKISDATAKELADYINLLDLRDGKRFTYVWRA